MVLELRIRLSTFCLLLVFLGQAVLADEVYLGNIHGQLRMPDDTPVNMTKISLNDGDHITYSRVDGTFSFYNVGPGVHLLDVHSHSHLFSQVKIQLLEKSMDKPKCIEYSFPGAPKQVAVHPLILKAHATYEYFEKRPGFSVFSILGNPMMLMMVVSVGLMMLMPKMMEGLEPEEREKMKKQMEMQKDPSKMLSQILGDLTGTPEEEPKPKSRRKRDK